MENRKSLQRNRKYKKNQMGILELKNIITKIKNSFDGFNSKMEVTE